VGTPSFSIQSPAPLAVRAPVIVAFGAARLVLVAICFVALFSRTESGSWSTLAATALCVLGLLLGVGALASYRKREDTPDIGSSKSASAAAAVPNWMYILIDAGLALAIIFLVEASAAPLAWVALVIPVAEAALAWGVVAAGTVWFGLSLVHMAYVVLATEGSTSVTLAIQQLLAVLLVALPSALLMTSVRSLLQQVTEDHARSLVDASRLQTVAISAEKMMASDSANEVLRCGVQTAIDVGFDTADIVITEGDRHRVLVHHGMARNRTMPPELLFDAATSTSGTVVLTPDSDANRQALHLAEFQWGAGVHLKSFGLPGQAVLRAWSDSPIDPGSEGELRRVLALLAAQVGTIHSSAVANQWAKDETERLAVAAATDPLTQLANHGQVLREVTSMLAHGHETTIFFLDLDRFKPINDTYGHEAGDQALVIIARRLVERLQLAVGDAGLVGRMGGDEFVAVVAAQALTEATTASLSEEIAEVVQEPIAIGPTTTVSVGVSVGVSSGGPELSSTELLRRADSAMYSAKRSDDHWRLWSPEVDITAAHAQAGGR